MVDERIDRLIDRILIGSIIEAGTEIAKQGSSLLGESSSSV